MDDDAPLGGDGRSWYTAFRYLQDGFYLAQDDETMTEIRIGGGTYRPDEDEAGLVTVGDGHASFVLRDRAVSLRGGFRGLGEPGDPDEQGDAFETVIGPPDGTPTTTFGWVMEHRDERPSDAQESDTIVMERLAFRDVWRAPLVEGVRALRVEGVTLDTDAARRFWGSLSARDRLELVESSFSTTSALGFLFSLSSNSMIMQDCIFDGGPPRLQNTVVVSAYLGFSNASVFELRDSKFISIGVTTAAARVIDCDFQDAQLTGDLHEVTRCVFHRKSSAIGAPAIRSFASGATQISGCSFDLLGFGGGVHVEGFVDISDSTFSRSSGPVEISAFVPELLFNTGGVVDGSEFVGISAEGMWAEDLRDNRFIECEMNRSGAGRVSGTEFVNSQLGHFSAGEIRDSKFIGCSGLVSADLAIGSVFAGSSVGVVYADELVACTFVGDEQFMLLPAGYSNEPGSVVGSVVVSASPLEATIHDSVLWGDGFDQGQAGGNVLAAPVFVHELGPDGEPFTGDEDWTLAAGSPGVDLAEVGLLDGLSRTDLNGNPRFVDSTGDGVFRMDAGAFERQDGAAAMCEVELLSSGAGFAPDSSLTVQDLTRYVEQWLAHNPFADNTTMRANPGDEAWGERDGAVSVEDLTRYVELWIEGCAG